MNADSGLALKAAAQNIHIIYSKYSEHGKRFLLVILKLIITISFKIYFRATSYFHGSISCYNSLTKCGLKQSHPYFKTTSEA